MILSVHADTLSMRLSVWRWEYYTLRACWGACWEYQRALRVSAYSQHALRVSYSLHAMRVSVPHTESMIISEWYSQCTLRVWYSQLMLRAWYSNAEGMILSACAESMTLSCWEYHIFSVSDTLSTCWEYYVESMILLACASACSAESMILSVHAEAHAESISMRWEYHTLCVILPAYSERINHADSMILSICNHNPLQKS